ncbi:hypothetical protein, partial [Nocardioides sp.]|uniref:hypothetical protein n=1 Tax=Nocardioides sp. TaxID=35761 RepID=UPI002EDAF82F
LLCNESFSSTNEREAAIIGAEVIHGLTDAGVHVCLVTHAYELAERLRVEIPTATFLRAARLEDGTRSHEIVPGKPLRTSFGADLYEEIFGEPLTTAPSCPPSPAASDARGGCQADRCRPSRKG